MLDNVHVESLKQTLRDKVIASTGVSPQLCYQCGKCSAGCPLIDEMDIAPNQILRMLQYDFPEFEDKILRSLSIWLCLSCETCYARCPKEVEFPLIMDYLRSESLRQNKVNPKAKEILAFHQTFLNTIKSGGRSFEVGLIAGYKLKTMNLMQDVAIAPTLFLKGKLKLIPHTIKGKDAIARIFEKTLPKKEGEI